MSAEIDQALSRIVGVEEHVGIPELTPRLPEVAYVERGFQSRDAPFGAFSALEQLADTEGRLADLDRVGLTVQVLSNALPGADLLPPSEGAQWARDFNEAVAHRVSAHPDRYAAFAHLPLTDPAASADELERCVRDLGFKGALVNGSTNGHYLDDLTFEPLLSRAEALDVPIYLHPSPSPKPVRDALYGGMPDFFHLLLSTSGWGWHVDTAVHLLRIVLSGTFDRHPNLKLITGHLGEGLQVMFPRLDQQFHQFGGFKGLPSALLQEHVWVSIAGFLNLPSFQATLATFGPDRIVYSSDYPWGPLDAGRTFLKHLPVDTDVLHKIAHRNADDLLHLTPAT